MMKDSDSKLGRALELNTIVAILSIVVTLIGITVTIIAAWA